MSETKTRFLYLHVTEIARLRDWGDDVLAMFAAKPWIVGSVTRGPGWRDVDVRLILTDKRHRKLSRQVSIPRLNMTVSVWGQQATGLPIDFQVQAQSVADRYDGALHPAWRLDVRQMEPSP